MRRTKNNFEKFAADLPPERTLEFTSPEELEEALLNAGVEQPTRQLEKGEFRAQLATATIDQADLFSDRYSTAISLHVRPPPDSFGFLFPHSASGEFIAQGADVGNDHLLFFPPGTGADITGPALIGSDCIAVPQARFDELAEALCPAKVRPEFVTIFAGDPKQLQALRHESGSHLPQCL